MPVVTIDLIERITGRRHSPPDDALERSLWADAMSDRACAALGEFDDLDAGFYPPEIAAGLQDRRRFMREHRTDIEGLKRIARKRRGLG